MKTVLAGSLLFIKTQYFPNCQLLIWMTIAVILDLFTGIIKAVYQGQARTSSGYRKTVVKVAQYAGAIAAGVVLQNIGSSSDTTKLLLNYVNDGLVIFISYIEITSIFENLNAIDNKTPIARYFYQPILKLLTFSLRNNPISKQAELIEESNNPK